MAVGTSNGHATAIIAVVEDDFAVRNALAFALKAEGFSVRSYTRAEDVLADALLAEIDCFVVDYRLPAMSGIDLLMALRAAEIAVPAILIATMAGPSVRAAADKAGAIVLEKPLIDGELFELIRGVLTGGPPNRSA